MLNEIKKAILSGIMISIGASAYLSCLDKGLVWLGAILFSAGLFTIFTQAKSDILHIILRILNISG